MKPPRRAFSASPKGAPLADRQSRIRGGRSIALRLMRRGCRFGAMGR